MLWKQHSNTKYKCQKAFSYNCQRISVRKQIIHQDTQSRGVVVFIIHQWSQWHVLFFSLFFKSGRFGTNNNSSVVKEQTAVCQGQLNALTIVTKYCTHLYQTYWKNRWTVVHAKEKLVAINYIVPICNTFHPLIKQQNKTAGGVLRTLKKILFPVQKRRKKNVSLSPLWP